MIAIMLTLNSIYAKLRKIEKNNRNQHEFKNISGLGAFAVGSSIALTGKIRFATFHTLKKNFYRFFIGLAEQKNNKIKKSF